MALCRPIELKPRACGFCNTIVARQRNSDGLTFFQYAAYDTVSTTSSQAAQQTSESNPVNAPPPPAEKGAQVPIVDPAKEKEAAGISGAPPVPPPEGQRVVKREQRVE